MNARANDWKACDLRNKDTMATLANVNIGRTVRVERILETGDLGLRLMEMGLTPGVEVTLLGAAPLGDPLEFELRGYRLSLRKAEAALVEVGE